MINLVTRVCSCFPGSPSPAVYPLIRFFNAAPGSPPLDIYIDGYPLDRSISYRNVRDYFPVRPGNYTFAAYAAGQQAGPLLQTEVSIPAQSAFTLVWTGIYPQLHLVVIPDYTKSISNNIAFVRFINLSPLPTGIDIVLGIGSPLVPNLSFGTTSKFASFIPGSYNILFRSAESQAILANITVGLRPNGVYSIYNIGLFSGQPQFETLISPGEVPVT